LSGEVGGPISLHVARMLHGAAGTFWESLKNKKKFCNTMQHEIGKSREDKINKIK
jgi:hypothetical protein